MASKDTGQRIGIWIIAIVMTVGTIGSFAVIILANKNQVIDQQQTDTQQADYEAQIKAQSQANADNSVAFDDWSARTFDPNVTTLGVEVLVPGTGVAVAATDSINASYFGWLSDGTIFDSSKKKGGDDTPITFSLAQVISGWTTGLTGIKEGSVVRLTIPADQAYKDQASGIIPANSPLEFIVKVHKIDNSNTAS